MIIRSPFRAVRFAGPALPASALVYTLAICLLVGTILGSLVLLQGYVRLESDRIYHQALAADNLESGLNRLLYGHGEKFGSFRQSLFGSEVDSFYAESRVWGLYGAVAATGVHGRARATDEFLFGLRPEGIYKSALFLEDRNRPLTIAGNTVLEGDLYLPEAGLKRGYVGRKGFTGKQLYRGHKHSSREAHDPFGMTAVAATTGRLAGVWSGAFAGNWQFRRGDSLSRSWAEETLELRSAGRLYINEVSLRGNILVEAPEIWVGRTADLEHVLLFGHRIYFEAGFSGRLQAFATDTLEIGRDCRLGYPSVLLVSNPEGHGLLRVHSGTSIEGMLVHDRRFSGGVAKPQGYTVIADSSEVYGTVIADRNLDLKGKVCGTVVTGGFLLRTPAAIYENHLLNAEITRRGLSERYAMGLLIPAADEFVPIERIRK